MVVCKKCGKQMEEEAEYCTRCSAEKNLKNRFYVLRDIDKFDVFEEDKFKAKQKRKKTLIYICVTVTVLIAGFIGIKWTKNISYSYDVTSADKTAVQHAQEPVELKEEISDSENTFVAVDGVSDGGNNIDELRETVMKFCNRYNNGRTFYEGELIAVVPDRKTILVTYYIPKVIPAEEKDSVIELEEEIKKDFLVEAEGKFPEEITVNIKTIVSYR